MPGALAPLASYADPAIRRGDPTGTTSVVMKNDKIWRTGGASQSEVRQDAARCGWGAYDLAGLTKPEAHDILRIGAAAAGNSKSDGQRSSKDAIRHQPKMLGFLRPMGSASCVAQCVPRTDLRAVVHAVSNAAITKMTHYPGPRGAGLDLRLS